MPKKQIKIKKNIFISCRKTFSYILKKIKTRFINLPLIQKIPENKRGKILKLSIFLAGTLFLFFYIFKDLPLPTTLSEEELPVSTKIYDRNLNLIYEIFADKRRTPIKIDDLPEYVKQATISIEDKDFYKHHGFSLTGLGRAIYSIIFKGELQGGSTITQQLVKNTMLTQERTLRRKIREFLLSLAVETLYSKKQILEMYLNQVPYGGTAWGIEAAAEGYFGKSAKDLDLAEAALLAGLPAAPSQFSPFGSTPELAKERQAAVLRRMVEDKYITQEEADKALAEKLVFVKQKDLRAPHFALWVKDQLVSKYGLKTVEQGGLIVKTTLDLEIQDFAQNAVASEVARLKNQKVGNGAAVITNPKTGEILAMVGSKDYFAEDEDGKVNMTLAKRQPGSAIKPLNYALAILNKKITPATVILDIPTCFQIKNQPLYCPTNYDGTFHGITQTRFALGNSYNIPAVKVLALNGLSEFIDFARRMGITTFEDPSKYGLSITLGGGEVKMVDMATAFGVFLNGGIKQDLVSILQVSDWKGKVLEKHEFTEGDRIIPIEVSYLIYHILLDNNARIAAFGDRSYLVVAGHPEVAVKTGTTNDRRDNWTIGGNPEALVVTWVGNNNYTSMSGAVSGVSGASPIWNKTIKFTLDKMEDGQIKGLGDSSKPHSHIWLDKPEEIVGATICTISGLLPPGPADNPGCQTRYEYFLKGTVPTDTENLNRPIPIDKTTGQVAGANTPPQNIDIQNHPAITDLWGSLYCLDCPFPSQPVILNPQNIPSSKNP